MATIYTVHTGRGNRKFDSLNAAKLFCGDVFNRTKIVLSIVATEKRKLSPKQQAFLFFYKHAGFSFDPKTETKRQGRAKGARELARAEREARAVGLEFSWEDSDECIGCDCDNPECKCSSGERHECYWVACVDENGNILSSLGSVCEPSREYRRVVEAELALEALAGMEVEA